MKMVSITALSLQGSSQDQDIIGYEPSIGAKTDQQKYFKTAKLTYDDDSGLTFTAYSCHNPKCRFNNR